VKSAKHALVVGGGVIGLTSAFQLALHGWRVTLFDPNPGGGATWAAAGMIAPIAEIGPGEESNYQLQRGAVDAWRSFASDLHDVTQKDLVIVEKGTLLFGWDGSDRRLVDQFAQIATDFGVVPRRVSMGDEPAMFEGVSPRISDGLLIGGDAWLDPDQAVALVSEANTALGVTVVDEVVVKVCRDPRGGRYRIGFLRRRYWHHRHRGERVAERRDVIRWSHRTTGPRNNAPRSRPRSKRAAHDPIIREGRHVLHGESTGRIQRLGRVL
jgi:glycine/D-amino acid oxidase-like deaminating enzyme